MELNIVEETRKFLMSYISDKSCEYETIHTWRKDSTFIILHSLRVYSYAMKIMENEKSKLTSSDILLIQVSAILHDIGKCNGKEDHAIKSAEIVDNWLNENPQIADGIQDKEKLLAIISSHSDKDKPDNDLCSAIIKDADILDEIGVLSIFMTSNQIDRYSPYFFNKLLDRIQMFELKYCNNQMEKLNTFYAKQILQDKITFIRNFALQLKSELNGTEDLYSFFTEEQ